MVFIIYHNFFTTIVNIKALPRNFLICLKRKKKKSLQKNQSRLYFESCLRELLRNNEKKIKSN